MELNIARRNGEAVIESFGDSGNLENLVKRFKVCWSHYLTTTLCGDNGDKLDLCFN